MHVANRGAREQEEVPEIVLMSLGGDCEGHELNELENEYKEAHKLGASLW